MYINIDSKKAGRSYKCCKDHPQGRALGVVQKQLLTAVDRYMTARRIDGDETNVLALRQLSVIYALVATKRALQAAI